MSRPMRQMPEGWQAPSLGQYYRALDVVAGLKADTEEFLFSRLCDLTSMDLRFLCCDSTPTRHWDKARIG